MTKQSLTVFETSVADAHQWVNAIDDALGYDDKHLSLQLLRGVLHALRDRLTIDQSAHLSAQLPLLIRGLYFENWDPQPFPDRGRSVDAFMDDVRRALTGYPQIEVREGVGAVFGVLKRHISWGEDEKIGKALPHAIEMLWSFTAA